MLCTPRFPPHVTIQRLFRVEFSIHCFLSPLKPRVFPAAASLRSLPPVPRELLRTIWCCRKSGMPFPKNKKSPFPIWAWWIVSLAQRCGSGCGGDWGKDREGLPRALRSSSKFSLFFIFQVPAKLGMSAEAEWEGSRKNLFHALMISPLSLFDSFSPSSFAALPCPLLWAQPPAHTVNTQLFLFLYSHTHTHTHSCRFFHPCVSVCWMLDVFSSFLATVFNERQCRSLPPPPTARTLCPINTGEQDWHVCSLWGSGRLNSFF